MRSFFTICTVCLLLIAVVLVSGNGCGKRPSAIPPDPTSDKPKDSVGLAYQLIKNAETVINYREALDHVNAHLNKSPDDPFPAINAADRKMLNDAFALTAKEIDFVSKARFQPLDAAHLNTRLFIRDVAKTLRVAKLPKVEQARLVCAWVAQQVVLQEPAGRWYPPRWSLLSGEGNTIERAMLIVSLLQQMEIDACVVKSPKDSSPLMIGVLAGTSIYVLDPRLGVPVAGPNGKGVATLKDVQAQPQLTAKHGMDAKQASQMQPSLICSLPELAPRMRYLEKSLGEHDEPVVLAVNPEAILKKWRTASQQATVWNRKAGVSPLRALPMFFPDNDDPSSKQATVALYSARLVPSGVFFKRMGELGLLTELIRDDKIDPQQRLSQWCSVLFVNYALAPRQQSLQGQYDAMNKRMTIIRKAISDIEFAPLGRAELEQKVLKWKKQVNDAYLKWNENAEAIRLVNAIWADDLFLQGLLLTPEDESFRKFPKKLLTYMLMAIVQSEIEKEAKWLSAQHWHTKAARQQDAEHTDRGWSAAQRWWQKYLASYDLSVPAVHDRIGGFSNSIVIAFEQWDRLATDLTRAAQAKCLLAETYHHKGETENAKKQWRKTEQAIAALLGDKKLRNELTAFINAAKQPASGNIVLASMLNRLTNLLDANGSLANLQKRAAFHQNK